MDNVHIFKKHGKWIFSVKGEVCLASESFDEIVAEVKKQEASEPDWKLHVPEELPLPEVREYDSMKEAIAEED